MGLNNMHGPANTIKILLYKDTTHHRHYLKFLLIPYFKQDNLLSGILVYHHHQMFCGSNHTK